MQVIPSFEIGGAEKVVLDYLIHLNANEVEVMAVSLSKETNSIYDQIIKEKKLNVIYLDKKPGLDLSLIKILRETIKDFQPDVIHTHMHTLKYVFFSLLFNKSKVNKFHTIHNEPYKDGGKLDKLINKLAFKYFNWTPLALTDELQKSVNNFYSIEKTKVAFNGIDLSLYNKEEPINNTFRKENNINDDALIVGHIGRFSIQKNHQYIIDVFAKAFSKNQNIYLILIGEGELQEQIKLKVKRLNLEKNVLFLGLRKDIPELLSVMDIFIFPSLHEGLPISLIEAQASDVTCLISDQIDKKVIASKKTISLSLVDNIDEWAEAMLNPSKETNVYNDINSFDITNVLKNLLYLYKNNESGSNQ